MRFLFLLILLAGLGLGVLYPWATTNFSGHEIGTWRVYEQGRFKSVDVQLDAGEAPVRVLVDLRARTNQIVATPGHTVLTITASKDGHTALAQTLSFTNANPRQSSPQVKEFVFRDDAGLIGDVQTGTYTFTVGPGDEDGIDTLAVDLILRSGAGAADGRAQPVGYSLMAVGFIGLILALRRGKGGPPQNPNSQPPPPRWGRNAS